MTTSSEYKIYHINKSKYEMNFLIILVYCPQTNTYLALLWVDVSCNVVQ